MNKLGLPSTYSLLCLATMSCGTLFNGTKQEVEITSTPAGASITVNGEDVGVTPCKVKLARGQEHVVRISSVGYETYALALTRKMSGWVWLNVLFLSFPGLAIDDASGGGYYLVPERIDASLRAEGVR